jgi:outer membrane receptor for ferrienterochelin and colicins
MASFLFATIILNAISIRAAHALAPTTLALLLQSVFPAAHAQQAPAETRPAETKAAAKEPEPQKVEVKAAANAYDARRYDTATKIVVTQEEILKHGDTTVADVLKRLPGVTSGGGIRMRGLGGGYTQFLINGEPMPPGFSLDTLSPDMIERIEIMRAATAEYSTQAIAGTINIVLKKAVQTAQRDLRIGLADENGRVSANTGFQIADKMGALSYSIGGGMWHGGYGSPSHDLETVRAPSGELLSLRSEDRAYHGTYDGLNVSVRANWIASPNDTITSQSFLNYNRNQTVNTNLTTVLAGSPPPFVRGGNDSNSHFAMARTDINWIRKLGAGAKLDMKVGANYNDRNSASAGSYYDAFDRLALQYAYDGPASDKGVTASGKYSTPIVENHALAAGWDAAWSDRDEESNKTETSPTGLAPDNQHQVLAATVRRLALFAQDEWNITQQWSVYFGLRWEGIETLASSNLFGAARNRSSVWSPLFQTLWKIPGSKADQVRLALTRTYRPPSTGSLVPRFYHSRENTALSPDYQGNANLKPELAWGLDLGVEHFLENGGSLNAGVFARRIENVINTETQFIGGRWTTMPGNNGTADVRGIELDAKVPLRSVWKEAPGIDLRANLTRAWSHVSTVPGPDNRLNSQVPVSANLGVDYKMDKGPLSLGGNIGYQGAGPVRVSPIQLNYSVPRRSLDLYALWKFDPKNQLRVSLSNALHQDSYSETRYTTAAATSLSQSRSPSYTAVRVGYEMKL